MQKNFSNSRLLTAIIIAVVVTLNVSLTHANVLYVSAAKGQNSNAGTSPSEPLSSIQKAINEAQEANKPFTIKVAAGEYTDKIYGTNITIKSSVTVEGGYTEDFKSRNPFKNLTHLIPALPARIAVKVDAPNQITAVVDGFVIDASHSQEYKGNVLGNTTYGTFSISGLRKKSSLTIRNCILLNAGAAGINVGTLIDQSKLEISNNLFVCNKQGISIQALSTAASGDIKINNNTIVSSYDQGIYFDCVGINIAISKNLFANHKQNVVANNSNTPYHVKYVSFTDNGIYSTAEPTFHFSADITLNELQDTELSAYNGNKKVDQPFTVSGSFTNKTKEPYSRIELDDALQFLPEKSKTKELGAKSI